MDKYDDNHMLAGILESALQRGKSKETAQNIMRLNYVRKYSKEMDIIDNVE